MKNSIMHPLWWIPLLAYSYANTSYENFSIGCLLALLFTYLWFQEEKENEILRKRIEKLEEQREKEFWGNKK